MGVRMRIWFKVLYTIYRLILFAGLEAHTHTHTDDENLFNFSIRHSQLEVIRINGKINSVAMKYG